MKLSGTIGVTQKTMTFDTHVWLIFFTNVKSLGTMRDTRKTMTISATSFRGCNRFSPLLICTYFFKHSFKPSKFVLFTLPKTNSSPLNIGHLKRKLVTLVFQPSILCYFQGFGVNHPSLKGMNTVMFPFWCFHFSLETFHCRRVGFSTLGRFFFDIWGQMAGATVDGFHF